METTIRRSSAELKILTGGKGISLRGQGGWEGENDTRLAGPERWPPRLTLGLKMYQVQQTCKCGGKYWPAQKWIHEKCGVVNDPEMVTTSSVVNAVVNKSNPDRHKDKEARRVYMREYMRKRRAKV